MNVAAINLELQSYPVDDFDDFDDELGVRAIAASDGPDIYQGNYYQWNGLITLATLEPERVQLFGSSNNPDGWLPITSCCGVIGHYCNEAGRRSLLQCLQILESDCGDDMIVVPLCDRVVSQVCERLSTNAMNAFDKLWDESESLDLVLAGVNYVSRCLERFSQGDFSCVIGKAR